MRNLVCNECNVSIENGEYCKLCAPHMVSTKEKSMSVLNEQRKAMITKLYGEDAVANEELMFMDRNTRQVAYDATKCGVQLDQVLTRSEIEDLARTDADYEPVERDVRALEAGVKDKYTRGQIVDLMYMSGNGVELDIEPTIEEQRAAKPVFISKEQKQINFDFYVRRVQEATKMSTIAWIGAQVYQAVQASVRTWESEDGQVEAPTFFPAGKTKEFWSIYKDRKEHFAADYSLILLELKDFIKECKLPSKIKLLKKDIYERKDINFDNKKELWAACDIRIDELMNAA